MPLQDDLERRDVHTGIVDRYAEDVGSAARESSQHAVINRILYRDAAAWTGENMGHEIERLLATVGNDKVVAGPRHACCHRLIQQIASQGSIAAGRTQLQNVE